MVADSYVLAAATASVPLAASAGVYLPLYPVKGYSLTVPAPEEAVPQRPLITVEPLQYYITTYGAGEDRRVRFASIAEFGGWDVGKVSPSCAG